MTWKKTLAFVMAAATVFTCAFSTAYAAKDDENVDTLVATTTDSAATETEETVTVTELEKYADIGNNIDEKYMAYEAGKYTNYLTFLKYFSDQYIIKDKINVDIKTDVSDMNNTELKGVEDHFGTNKDALVIGQEGYVDFTVNVEEAGLYHLAFDYLPIVNQPIGIEVSFLIDGGVQYKESTTFMFNRLWTDDKTKDENGNWPMRDLNDNEITPEQVEVLRWTNYTIHDVSFSSDSDLLFYFSEGTHSIKINVLRQSLALAGVTLGGAEEVKSYSDVYDEYKDKGYKSVKDKNITIHAEYTDLKSRQSLMMGAEYTASTTNGTGDNLHYAKTRLNVFGGENWTSPGTWVEYDVDVDESGLYALSFKYKQDYVVGMNVYRKLTIDGELPYQELAEISFAPTSVWKNFTVCDEKENPYYVYLEKGTHTIRLTATFGPIAHIVQNLEAQASELNKWYMKIVQITGASPDTLRDYDLHKTIPGLIDGFEEVKKELEDSLDELIEINGDDSGASILKVLIKQLEGFIEDPATISGALTGYKSNIAELTDKVVSMKSQSLLLDSVFLGDETKLPFPKKNFTEAIEFAAKGFLSSFANNYSGYGELELEEGENGGYVCEPLTVWMSGGREQYNIISRLVEDKFTSKYKIPVKIMLGGIGDLTKAILAGIAPDISLSEGSDTPIGYAMRGALVDLTQFNDEDAFYDTTFDEAYTWFHKSAFIALQYQDGGVYGLPTSQDFSVLFVRSDILNDYDLEIPETWEDIYQMLPLLQRNNMSVAIGSLTGHLVLQNGGNYYVEDKSRTTFDSELYIDAFTESCELNTKWGIPLSFDAFNRFRTGEMPIMMGGYTMVNSLQVSAPELQGLWEMALLPGVKRIDENGNEYIDHTQLTGGGCCIMIDVNEMSDYAWQFMTWWCGADAQAEFNIKNEAILVRGARGTPANLEAFERLPWSYEHSQVIKEQWEWLYDIPRVPGDYYIGRQIANAFRAVVYDGRNPREALLHYNKDANVEIQRKRVEYNVDRFYEEGYYHADQDGNPIHSIIDNETYERPTNYFNVIK